MAKTKQISNPAGVWGLSADVEQAVIEVVNNSGGTLAPGDVVIIDVTGVLANTTTAASNPRVIGVVAEPSQGLLGSVSSGNAYPSGSPMPVIVRGPARINIGTNTVASGAALATSTTAKVAAVPGTAGSVGALQALVGSFIAIASEADSAKDANNTIRCYVQKM